MLKINEKSIIDNMNLTEKMIFSLRSLYASDGYSRYCMSKFDEYDVYSRHKDFLSSDGMITFTDTNGKLKALKPDVTMSIVTNSKDRPDSLQKIYYNEKVYRISKSSGCYTEIDQTGLECLGRIEKKCIRDVMTLAASSLALISDEYILQVSDMDVLSAFISETGADSECTAEIRKCAAEKNLHGIECVMDSYGIEPSKGEHLLKLLKLHGSPDITLPAARDICDDAGISVSFTAIENAIEELPRTNISIDFSLTANPNFYNGIIFSGFINGIPEKVLSGGQYDHLMKCLNRKSGAIGFAVYTDALSKYLSGKENA